MLRAIALLVCLVLAAPSAAQSTRVAAIAELQAEKARHLAVEGPPPAERIVRRVLGSPLLNGSGRAYPWFGSVFGGSGMAIGAGYIRRLEKAAAVNVLAGLSINGSTLLEAGIAAPLLLDGRLRLDATARRTDARRVSFYGVGAGSTRSRERYRYRPLEFGGSATIKPARWLAVTGGVSALDIESHADQQRGSGPLAAPGLGEDLRYRVSRAGVAFDSRNAPGYSTRGSYLRAAWEDHHESGGRPYSFRTQEYEATQLLPLVGEQFVLAGRGLVTLAHTGAGHELPVMLAPFLGGGSTLRGFTTRRFIDRNRLLLTGEYRWRPSRYLDMALFLDAGQVAADRREFRASALETSWGLGARFHGPGFTALRVEIARSREGAALIFAGTQVF
jgi:outer membrane protein assembly factor BamA